MTVNKSLYHEESMSHSDGDITVDTHPCDSTVLVTVGASCKHGEWSKDTDIVISYSTARRIAQWILDNTEESK